MAARKWARRIGAAILGILSGAVGLALIALIAIHSPWGQDYLRETIERTLAENIDAPVSLESVRVSLDGQISLGGLAIGRRGDIAAIGELTAKIDLVEAISGRIRIDRIDSANVHLDLLALVDVLRLPPPDPNAEPLDLSIARIGLTSASIIIGDVRVRIDELSSSLHMGALLSIPDARLRGGIEYGSAAAEIEATARLIGDLLVVDNTTIGAGSASLRLHFATLDLASLRAVALASADAPSAEIKRLAGQFDAGDAVANLSADGNLPVVAAVLYSLDPIDVWAAVAGTVGTARLHASANYRRGVLAGAVTTANLNPSAVWAGAPDASIYAELAGEVNLSELAPETLTASVSGRAGGTMAGESVELTDIRLTATDGSFAGSLSARTGRGSATASAKLAVVDQVWNVLDSSITANNLSLGMFGVAKLRGEITNVTIKAKGPVDQLGISVTARARSIRYDGASASNVAGSMSVVANLFALPDVYPTGGRLSVTARGVSYGGETLDAVSATGRFAGLGNMLALTVSADGHKYAQSARAAVTIRRSPARTSVEFGKVAVTTKDMTWTGDGGAVTVTSKGQVEIEDIELSSPAGTVSADGTLHELLVVEAKAVDLERLGRTLNALFGVEIPLTGVVSVKAIMRDNGEKLDVQGSFSTLKYAALEQQLDGDLSLALADGELAIVVHATEKASAAILKLDGALAAPRSALDAAGWSRIDARSVRRGVISLERVSPALISAIINRPIEASGTADLKITVVPGATRLTIDLDARNVAVAGMDQLEADVDIGWDEGGASLDVVTRRRKRPLARFSGRLEVPLSAARTLRPRDWKRASVSGKVMVSRLALNRLNRLNLVHEPLHGTLNAEVKLSGTIERPVGEVVRGELLKIRVAGAQVPTIKFGGRADLDGAIAWLEIVQSDKGSLNASITTEWLRPEKTVLDVTAKKWDLRVLRALASEPTHILALAAGTLDAGVHLVGDPRAPVGKGSAKLRGGQLLLEGGARRLTKVALDVSFDDDQIDIKRLTARSGEGSLSARGSATLRNYLPRSFALDIQTERFPFIAGAFAIGIDVKARVTGKIDGGWVRAKARVTSGLIRLERSSRSLHSTGDLEDVVYIDEIDKPGENAKTGGIPPIEIEVSAKQPIRVKGKELDLRVRPLITAIFLDGGLNSVQGRVWATSGWIALFDRRYTVIVAEAAFDGRVENPSIDVQISRHFPIAEVRVHVYNDVEDPKISLTSDAGHDSAEVVAIMLGGDPEGDDRTIRENAVGAGYGAGSLIAKNFAQYLPVRFDVVRIHEDGFAVGRWFFGQVLAGYRFRNDSAVTDENQHEGTLEWNIRRRLVLEARYGNQAIGDADLLYILRF